MLTALPPALLNATDRLITALMPLVDAVTEIALGHRTADFPGHAADTLAYRLLTLVTNLVRIAALGHRPRTTDDADPPEQDPSDDADPPDPAARARPTQIDRLPSRPGWLVAALPDLAPAIAADLRALLADPAVAELLAAAPALDRALRPILRSLGLTPAQRQPPPSPSTPDPTPSPPQRPPEPAQRAPEPHFRSERPPAPAPSARPKCSDIEQ